MHRPTLASTGTTAPLPTPDSTVPAMAGMHRPSLASTGTTAPPPTPDSTVPATAGTHRPSLASTVSTAPPPTLDSTVPATAGKARARPGTASPTCRLQRPPFPVQPPPRIAVLRVGPGAVAPKQPDLRNTLTNNTRSVGFGRRTASSHSVSFARACHRRKRYCGCDPCRREGC